MVISCFCRFTACCEFDVIFINCANVHAKWLTVCGGRLRCSGKPIDRYFHRFLICVESQKVEWKLTWEILPWWQNGKAVKIFIANKCEMKSGGNWRCCDEAAMAKRWNGKVWNQHKLIFTSLTVLSGFWFHRLMCTITLARFLGGSKFNYRNHNNFMNNLHAVSASHERTAWSKDEHRTIIYQSLWLPELWHMGTRATTTAWVRLACAWAM